MLADAAAVTVNVAFTDLAADMATVQVPEVAVHAPLHPLKSWPASGVAVSVTEVPLENDAEHREPQLIPDGELDTAPLPERLTVSFCAVDWLPDLPLSSDAAADEVASRESELPPPQAVRTTAHANNAARTSEWVNFFMKRIVWVYPYIAITHLQQNVRTPRAVVATRYTNCRLKRLRHALRYLHGFVRLSL